MNIYWVDWRKLSDIIICQRCGIYRERDGEGWYANKLTGLWCPPCWIKTGFKQTKRRKGF